jgi:hypothetical protein
MREANEEVHKLKQKYEPEPDDFDLYDTYEDEIEN